VATLDEAAELKGLCDGDRILIMGGLLPKEAAGAAQLGVAITCSSVPVAEALAAAAASPEVPVHVKVDTGMGRYGCRPEEAAALATFVAEAKGLRLAGTCTHFASAESDPDLTRRQFRIFEQVLAALPVEPGVRHACNSAAALRHPEMALDAVRAGIALYGCEWPDLEPVLSLRSVVTHVKTVDRGCTVGYGATWRAEQPTRVATVAIGYADGVHRARSGRGWTLVKGARAPVIGRVSMDAITLDVSAAPEVEVGDVVTLIGRDGDELITAEMVAEWSNTISYEVLTSIGPRVVRRVHDPRE
jgi:alanine racemase